METARYFAFESYCLDVLDERLWKDAATVPLGSKALAVLATLVGHPNQLVSKDALLRAAWPDTAVGDAVLTTAVREVRAALGDTARAPRFVQTVYGRGYRFIAPVLEVDYRPGLRSAAIAPGLGGIDAGMLRTGAQAAGLVGRDAEWTQLRDWFTVVRLGTRRVGLVTGEAGIGKTALVDAFVAAIAAATDARIGRGQCIEQYGAGEAYLPIFDALGRLARDPGVPLARVLREHAPSWLAHLPSLAPRESDLVIPVRPERMLRELTEALDVLAAAAPLVLVLEDLQWSDSATLEWLAWAARRRDAARLLVLGTCRPVETRLRKTPLRGLLAELRRLPQCGEIALDHLSREAIDAYLRYRCGEIPERDDLVDTLHRRTGGHPLFLASLVDELIQPGHAESDQRPALDLRATAHAMPVNVRQFIDHHVEQLSEDDQTMLEAAAVAGDPFSVAAVAAATGLAEERIEARCAAWTRPPRLLTADGVAAWPDGTRAARYQFRHALFHEAAYSRIPSARQARLHDRIGRRLEAAYGRRTSSIAAELAVHFERGRDPARAAAYLEQAARNAVSRSAYLEARRHVERALTTIASLPEGRLRLRREAAVSLLRAQVLEAIKGWSADEVADAYARARELWAALRDGTGVLQATWGLTAVSLVRAETRKTAALAREMLALAKTHDNPFFRTVAHAWMGGAASLRGRTRAASRHFRLAEGLYDPRGRPSTVAMFGIEIGIFVRVWSTHLLWHEGYPDRARARAEETMRVAAGGDHPFTRTITLAYSAMLAQFRRDLDETERLSAAAIAHAAEHGFPYYLVWSEMLRAWTLGVRGAGERGVGERAIAEIVRGIDIMQQTAGVRLPYYRALLAEVCGRAGRIDQGLHAIAAAFEDLERTDERWSEAELHRVRGDLLELAGAPDDRVERSYRAAVDVARDQQARALHLRAAVSLARLWQRQDRHDDARRLLAPIHDWFSEGFDTADLAAARALLAELSVAVP